MADHLYGLNRRQFDKVAGMAAEFDRTRENIAITSTTESGLQSGEDHQAPEVYLAISRDSDGIEGLNHSDQNLAGDSDLPGLGECDIYRIIQGRLSWIEKSNQVYNLSEARTRNDIFPVMRTKFGEWIIVNKHVEVEGILYKELKPATGPLTGAVFGYAFLIEWASKSTDDDVPDKWKITNRPMRFVNRSLNQKGDPGTFGRFSKLGGEFRPNLDCAPSEEGVQVVIEYEETLVSGGYGSGAYGDGTYGG